MRTWGLVVLLALAGCRESSPAAKKKPAPTITRLVPDQVTVQGYRLGQIEGDGFDTKAPVKVWFGATPSPRAAVVAKTKIQVEMPSGTDGTEVEVRVEVAGYEPATSPTKLRYISAGSGEHGGSADAADGSDAHGSDAVGSDAHE